MTFDLVTRWLLLAGAVGVLGVSVWAVIYMRRAVNLIFFKWSIPASIGWIIFEFENAVFLPVNNLRRIAWQSRVNLLLTGAAWIMTAWWMIRTEREK